MKIKRKQSAPVSDLFHPVEHAILADYLRVIPPKSAQDIDPFSEEELQITDDSSGIVRLRPDLWGEIGNFALENAVARLLLNSVQYRLPQWGTCDSEGNVQLARNINERRKRVISLLPQYLFEINWADSGPGYSWPEEYFVTFVPGYEKYIVTASADCPESYGYDDIAIGFYDKEMSLEDGCRDAITAWWMELTGGDEERSWQAFWDAGLIDDATAHLWARKVWGPSDEDFMAADMALEIWEKNAADSTRDSLVEYAVKHDYVWALEQFLDHRERLDEDWQERIEILEEELS